MIFFGKTLKKEFYDLIKKITVLIINLVLYSNVWIALAAVAMALQSQLILEQKAQLQPFHGLLFFGSLALYATHRLIGLSRIWSHQEGRYAIIRQLRTLVLILAILSSLAGLYFASLLSFRLMLWFIPAGLASLAYVVPFLKKKKRLRDVNYIKIFLIAGAWSWLTAFLPTFFVDAATQNQILALSLERFFFVFAITLPFDIRDLKIDREANVRTLPSAIGLKATRWLAGLSLSVMLLCAGWSFWLDIYTWKMVLALFLSALISYLFILEASPDRPDHYFTGWLDGMMILQPLLVWLANLI